MTKKIDYTHNNPVVAGFVENDYDYLHSSARDYAGTTGLVKVITTWRTVLKAWRILSMRATSEDTCGSGGDVCCKRKAIMQVLFN